jgi:hypothetical protein
MRPRWCALSKAYWSYEFGYKVAVAVTIRKDFVVASKALEGSPGDGYTLNTTMDQVIAIAGTEPKPVYGDRGYDNARKERVLITGQRRGLMQMNQPELRRRSAVEAMIATAPNPAIRSVVDAGSCISPHRSSRASQQGRPLWHCQSGGRLKNQICQKGEA